VEIVGRNGLDRRRQAGVAERRKGRPAVGRRADRDEARAVEARARRLGQRRQLGLGDQLIGMNTAPSRLTANIASRSSGQL